MNIRKKNLMVQEMNIKVNINIFEKKFEHQGRNVILIQDF